MNALNTPAKNPFGFFSWLFPPDAGNPPVEKPVGNKSQVCGYDHFCPQAVTFFYRI